MLFSARRAKPSKEEFQERILCIVQVCSDYLSCNHTYLGMHKEALPACAVLSAVQESSLEGSLHALQASNKRSEVCMKEDALCEHEGKSVRLNWKHGTTF